MRPEDIDRNNIPHFEYKVDSLAQWKVERGSDLRANAWGFFIAALFTLPPLAIVSLPFVYYYGRKGKKLEQEGKEEGGKGRPYKSRGSRFIPAVPDELQCGPGVRRVSAPIYPPRVN